MARLLILCAVLSIAACSVMKPKEDEVDVIANTYERCQSADGKTRCIGSTEARPAALDNVCLVGRNCTYVAAVEIKDSAYEFSMFSVDNHYVSVGFSLDSRMGNDSVISCLSDVITNEVNAELSFNNEHSNLRAGNNDGLTIVEAKMLDNIIYCKFTLQDVLAYARNAGSETAETFYFMVAAGPLNENGTLSRHTARAVTGEAWTFNGLDVASTFYNQCEKEDTRCIGAWNKSENEEENTCFMSKNCTFAAAVVTIEEGFEFSMLAVDKQYVSLGFSLDQGMGDDAVVSCLSNGTAGVLLGELSYNVGHKNQRAQNSEGLAILETKNEDGLIYCRFTLNDTLKYARTAKNDTDDDAFYLINVAGSLNEDGSVGHHMGHAFSTETWSFSSDAASLTISAILLLIATTFSACL